MVRIYLEASIAIYLIEQVSPHAAVIDARLKTSDAILVASDLTRMECRVALLRDGDVSLLKDYDSFFDEAVLENDLLTPQVIDEATEIRAHHNLKRPDSIHLAAAVTSGCEVFLTNDHRLERFGEIVEP